MVYVAIEDVFLKSVLQGRFDTFRSGSVCSPLPEAEFKETSQNSVYAWGMAILMPKGLAWGLFTKLGFQAVCEFPFYIYGVSSEELEK